MPEGPVTEGSIVAYVGADDADYQAVMKEAQATAERLAATDPTVTVHANTSEAMAKLAAVRAEQDAVSQGFRDYMQEQRGSAPMSGVDRLKQQIRDLQLPETYVTSDLATAQQRLATAKRAVALADRDLFSADTAVQRLMESSTPDVVALAGGYTKLKDAAQKYADVQASLVDAERGVADFGPPSDPGKPAKPATPAPSGGGGIGYGAGIAVGIAAVLPMLADVAGFLAADTGAFIGMGVAGTLAVLGIKSEMASGSAEGRVYSALIQQLKGNLGDLESTAASGVLTGFEAATQIINSRMPSLNTEILGFSHGLGQIATFSVDGLVTGFQTLNPLFNLAQAYIVGLAREWDSWVHDGGLTQWAGDVERVFPLVADTFGTLGQAILRIIGDLSPLGTTLLGTLDIVAHVTDFLAGMGSALGPVAIGAVAAYLAFRNFGTLAPILDTVTGGMLGLTVAQDAAAVSADGLAAGETAVEVAAGPAGWLILALSAGVGLLAAALTEGAQAAGQAATAQADYTAQVQQDSGVIGDNTRKQLAQNLAQSGAVTAAKQLGISTSQVTAAIVGGGAARDKLIAQLNGITAADKAQEIIAHGSIATEGARGQAAAKLNGFIQATSKALSAATTQYRLQNTAAAALALQAQNQITKNGLLTMSFGLTAAQIANSANEQDNLASQTAWVSTQLTIENTAAQNLQNELTLLDNGSLSLAQAQTAAASATLNMSSTLKKNKDALSLNTAAGIADRQAIEQKVQADQAAAAAVAKATGSQDAGTASLARSKAALERELGSLGLLTPAVKHYIDQIDQIPHTVSTTATFNVGNALAQAHALASAIAGIPSMPGGHVTAIGNGYAHSDGGPIYRAGGGFAPRGTDVVPAMLTIGEFVVKDKSAQYNPQFLKAYNADPEKALASVARPQTPGTVDAGVHIDRYYAAGESAAAIALQLGWMGRNAGLRRY